MARLTAQDRSNLPTSDFAIPSKAPASGSYPINDKKHAALAKSFVSRYGSPEEKAKVRAAVAAKFGSMKQQR